MAKGSNIQTSGRPNHSRNRRVHIRLFYENATCQTHYDWQPAPGTWFPQVDSTYAIVSVLLANLLSVSYSARRLHTPTTHTRTKEGQTLKQYGASVGASHHLDHNMSTINRAISGTLEKKTYAQSAP